MKTICSFFIFCALVSVLHGQSIVNTKHNLSVSGPGTVKASTETEICIFCHTMHNSNPLTPLWNRSSSGSSYTLYSSTTMKALPGQPSGSSILCLSCHDGTVALGNVLSRGTPISFASTVNMPVGPSNLTTDLRNDHPISFLYDVALSVANPNLKNPGTISPQIRLENGQLQCTSCHDPHKNIYTSFLVASSQYSGLCVSCHQIPNWTTATHNTSVKTWNGVVPNPWPYTPWTTVQQNACESCHNPHNSGSMTRLLQYPAEEDNCLNCHNGNVAGK
ncbi:MAG TPA: cytochrome c3 family protein, partial [Bacteroidia bacterium]|nr:cytochrome c3 family protein [Bacteroidia bacterium]